MTEVEPKSVRAKASQRFLLVAGGSGVAAFVALAVMGQGDVPPFGLAFLASAISEAIATRVISRREASLDWMTAARVIGAIAVFAVLVVAAVRSMAAPSTWASPISLVLGIMSGGLIADALLRMREPQNDEMRRTKHG